jgi:hypothetical protein
LLFEIEANKNCYVKNNAATLKANKRYMQGIGLTTLAILISILLLLVSTFMAIEKSPTKVQVVNSALKPVNITTKDSLVKTIIIPTYKK